MGGNFPGENFLGWKFSEEGDLPEGSLIVGNVPGGSFPDTGKKT